MKSAVIGRESIRLAEEIDGTKAKPKNLTETLLLWQAKS
jgi:hypothetical protein